MNQNDCKYDDTEYVFVEFDERGREKDSCDMTVKKKKPGTKKFFNYSLVEALQDGGNLDDCHDNDDDFSISSFDLCDEELAIDTSHAEMDHDAQGKFDTDDSDDDEEESLRLSQSPSVASVCTETLFESMKDQVTAEASSFAPAANGNEAKTSTTCSNAKKSRARSESNANSTASSSSIGIGQATSACSNTSRLSNKKRRKKIKQQKKAAAAAAAADALAAAQSRLKQTNNTSTATSSSLASISKPKKKCNATTTSIAVLCATQSLTQYRQEMGILNVNGQGHGQALKPHSVKQTDSHALDLIHSI